MPEEKKNCKPVTQHDVAREAGVTRSMVSYVLNGSVGKTVAPATRQKILDAIDRLGYKPNKNAQALQQGNEALAGRQIGVVLCSADVFLRPYYAEILAGIYTAAHDHNYNIRFIRFFDELKNPILFNELIHPEEISGLLLVATDQRLKLPDDERILEGIRARIKHIVCVEWQLDGLSSVGFNRQDAARMATDYLLKKGYSDIAYIGELDNRVSGFKQAFMEAGCNDLSSLVVDGALDMPSGLEAMKRLHEAFLENPALELPRAICAGSDEVAIGILHYLNGVRISVPGQVAVISIDNIEIAEYTNPPLTTMNIPKKAMGARAVEMIVKETAGQGENALSVLLPVNLVIRESA